MTKQKFTVQRLVVCAKERIVSLKEKIPGITKIIDKC